MRIANFFPNVDSKYYYAFFGIQDNFTAGGYDPATAFRTYTLGPEGVEIDGTRLVGHYFRTEGAKRTVIAFHGWRSAWYRDFAMIYDFWFKNDCSVLFVEQRGQKGSSGDYMGFGLLERFDCQSWVNYLTAREDTVTPLYLAGISMGASTVLMASGLNLPDCVHGILADCGFTPTAAIPARTP